MAEKSNFEEPLKRAFEANMRYYEALGKVTQEYWKSLFGIAKEMPGFKFPEIPLNIPGFGTATFTPGASASPPPAPKPANATAPASAATLVLEAEAGQEAQGVFMVENRLQRTVSTAVITSAFADPSGRSQHPALRVVPSVVTLEPGGRTLVQLFAGVTADMEADVPYRGEVSVPGLSDHSIPVVLRRRASAPVAAPVNSSSSPSPSPKKTRETRPTKKKSSSNKKKKA